MKNKVWTKDNRIIHVDIVEASAEEDIMMMLDEIIEATEKVSGKAKVLLNVMTTSIVSSSQIRARVGEKFKKINAKTEKVAIWGGNTLTRTIASFVITSSHLKKIKIFKTKKEALKWLG